MSPITTIKKLIGSNSSGSNSSRSNKKSHSGSSSSTSSSGLEGFLNSINKTTELKKQRQDAAGTQGKSKKGQKKHKSRASRNLSALVSKTTDATTKQSSRKLDDSQSINSGSTHTATTCSTMTNSLTSSLSNVLSSVTRLPVNNSSLSSHSSVLHSSQRSMGLGSSQNLEESYSSITKLEPLMEQQKHPPSHNVQQTAGPIYAARRRLSPGNLSNHLRTALASSSEEEKASTAASNRIPIPPPPPVESASSSSSGSPGSMTMVLRRKVPATNQSTGQLDTKSNKVRRNHPSRTSSFNSTSTMSLADYRQLSRRSLQSTSTSGSNRSMSEEVATITALMPPKHHHLSPPPPPGSNSSASPSSSSHTVKFSRDRRKSLVKPQRVIQESFSGSITASTPIIANRKSSKTSSSNKSSKSKRGTTAISAPAPSSAFANHNAAPKTRRTPSRQHSLPMPVTTLKSSPAHHNRVTLGISSSSTTRRRVGRSVSSSETSSNSMMQRWGMDSSTEMASSMERLSFAAYRESYNHSRNRDEDATMREEEDEEEEVSQHTTMLHSAHTRSIHGRSNTARTAGGSHRSPPAPGGSLRAGLMMLNPNSASSHATMRSSTNDTIDSATQSTNSGRLSLASYRSSVGHMELPMSSPYSSPILSAPNSNTTLDVYSSSDDDSDHWEEEDLHSDPEDTSICSESISSDSFPR